MSLAITRMPFGVPLAAPTAGTESPQFITASTNDWKRKGKFVDAADMDGQKRPQTSHTASCK